ncbi:protein kinase [bacterium]|nr:protein kinase [bacterium]
MKKVKPKKYKKIESFDFLPGRVLARKYEILKKLGQGWQGEVYLIREKNTGIERAAKFFFPHRNEKDKTAIADAKKMHALRNCPNLIQYHTQETIRYQGFNVTALVSDYVDGELLSTFLQKQPEQRLQLFEGLHLLYTIVTGVEQFHFLSEYHGDLHTDNVMVKRMGLGFDIKIFDPFHWGGSKKQNIQEDVFDVIRIFYESIGGKKHYASQPKIAKTICCGLKKSLIAQKFKNASDLKLFLETMEWE